MMLLLDFLHSFLICLLMIGGQSVAASSPFISAPRDSLLRRHDIKRAEKSNTTFPNIPASKELIWYPCYTNLSCSALTVPLNYLDPDSATAYLPIIKIPATEHPYKGLLFTNPGGPGASGVDILIEDFTAHANDPNRAVYLDSIPKNYDVVAWDPRGMGYSTPLANCVFPPGKGIRPGYKRTVKRDGATNETVDLVYGPHMQDRYFEDIYKWAEELGSTCASQIGGPLDAGPHMSTTVVVKDLITILDAFAASKEGKQCITNPKLFNFWGFSYGTFIGSLFATLFPHRVGYMVLDGVVDPIDWVETGELKSSNSIKELAFATFFVYCHAAGPTLCEFWEDTPHKIFLRFEKLILPLDPVLALQKGWENATKIEFVLSAMKGNIPFGPLKTHYPALTKQLVQFEALLPKFSETNISVFADLWQEDVIGTTIDETVPWFLGTYCSDQGGKRYPKTLEEMWPIIRALEKQSFWNGEHYAANPLRCATWPIKGVDVYEGPFGGKTRNPVLFVSNTLDYITPIQNGRIASSLFENAKLLTVEATGHTTFNIGNKCAHRNIKSFLENGTIVKGHYCPLEAAAWNITLKGPLLGGQQTQMPIGELLKRLG